MSSFITQPSLATSPTSPTSRPSRLRGLSYLRNYTHNHLHSRDSSASPTGNSRPFGLTRASSYPTPTATPSSSGAASPPPGGIHISNQRTSPTLQRSTAETANNSSIQDNTGPTSGWLPTGGGHSGVSSSLIQSAGAVSAEDTAMGRTRSGTASREAGSDISVMNGGSNPQLQVGSAPAPSTLISGGLDHKPTIRFSQHQDVRAPRPSLVFSPMGRTLPTGAEIVRVGRYSERETSPNQPANLHTAAPVGFKSKVVSRRHCEFWFQDGGWFIKDVKSSSGTFLNHVRLSSPGTESKPFPVKDGDIVQLGIDFKGGEEMIFRCVKIRVELNRAWQNGLNSFNVASHKRLRNMTKQVQSPTGGSSSQDCSICLGAVAPCQSLFVAPCSHTWHYKCVRRIINGPQWPHFVCPNCRAVADLEAEVDDPFPEGDWEDIDVEDESTNNQVSASETDAAPQLPQSTVQLPERPTPDASQAAVPRTEDTSRDVTASELSHAMNSLDVNPPDRSRQASNSSIGPIDIAGPRRSVSRRQSTSITATDQDHDLSERTDGVRTPSPSGILPGVDGPMTPRNDAGPFIFDGSAGNGFGHHPATLNVTASAETMQRL